MTKIIFIILGVILVAGGGYFFLSSKPVIQIDFNSPPAVPGTIPGVEIPTTAIAPVSGATITISDCRADPYILQVAEGTEVTIHNTDSQSHTLFVSGPNEEVKLAANGSVKIVAKFPQGKNVTYNYLCDGQPLPKGGAIYVQP